MKVITVHSTLMGKAKALGRARLAGDAAEIERAARDLAEYEALVLAADEHWLDTVNRGDL